MKYFIVAGMCLLSLFTSLSAKAASSSFKDEKTGYIEIKYTDNNGKYSWKDIFLLSTIADVNNFPLSSTSQRSVFNEIFEDLAEEEHIVILVNAPRTQEKYEELSRKLEKELDKWDSFEYRNSFFGKYYEHNPYSKMEYVYPAYFENHVYIITSPDRKKDIQTKDDLKNFKGIYIKSDYFSQNVLNDFKALKLEPVESFEKAFENLLTGKTEYVAANYYPSLIALYKLGLRNYVTYSQAPAWKMALFITATPQIVRHPRIKILKQYLQSPRYKKVRDDALARMVDFYKKTYEGTVPPAFIGEAAEKTEQNQTPVSSIEAEAE